MWALFYLASGMSQLRNCASSCQAKLNRRWGLNWIIRKGTVTRLLGKSMRLRTVTPPCINQSLQWLKESGLGGESNDTKRLCPPYEAGINVGFSMPYSSPHKETLIWKQNMKPFWRTNFYTAIRRLQCQFQIQVIGFSFGNRTKAQRLHLFCAQKPKWI